MVSLKLFINAFLSYLLVFIIFAVLIVAAVLIGIKVRKIKNAKEEVEKSAANIEAAAVNKQEA